MTDPSSNKSNEEFDDVKQDIPGCIADTEFDVDVNVRQDIREIWGNYLR